MSESKKSFVEQCLEGTATADQIDDFVERWHTGDDPRDLQEVLGFTDDEYGRWARAGSCVSLILEERRTGRVYRRPPYIQECLAGRVSLDAIEDYEKDWLWGKVGGLLHDYLGMTYKEWLRWEDQSSTLLEIIEAHRGVTRSGRARVSKPKAKRRNGIAARQRQPLPAVGNKK